MGKSRRQSTDEEDRERASELASRANALSPRMLEVTAPLYQRDPRGEHALVGSCLLLTLADGRFLVTARHVLDQLRYGGMEVGVSPAIVPLVGQRTNIAAIDAPTDSEDHIDVSIVRLEGPDWATIPTSQFLSWAELDIGGPIVARNTYGLLGYPHSKNKSPREGDRLRAHTYSMAGLEVDAEGYTSTGHSPETNVMVDFDRKAMWGPDGPRTAPDLYGVSGSGLWRYGRRLRDAQSPPLLSAVATEWHKSGRQKYILGTRIHIVIAALAEKYTDVRIFVAEQLQRAT